MFGRKKKEGGAKRQPPRIWQLFKATIEADKTALWWMIGAALGVAAVIILLGVIFNFVLFAVILAIPSAILAAIVVLGRKAEKIMFARMDGQPGASGAALQMVRRGGWTLEEQPVAVDPKTQAMVFRGYGRKGVLLVGEGSRVGKLLDRERKRVERLASGVPVHVLTVGTGSTQVPLKDLPKRVMRLKGKLTTAEVDMVGKRLKSLGGLKMPTPKGMDPSQARIDRRSMRGR